MMDGAYTTPEFVAQGFEQTADLIEAKRLPVPWYWRAIVARITRHNGQLVRAMLGPSWEYLATEVGRYADELERWQGVVADIVAAVPVDPAPFYERHGIPTCKDCGIVVAPEDNGLCGDCWDARALETVTMFAPSLYRCCSHDPDPYLCTGADRDQHSVGCGIPGCPGNEPVADVA